MFSCITGFCRSTNWREASMCKQHLQNLLCCIKVHRKRKECMVRHSQSDIHQLLLSKRLQETLSKAKHIYEDRRMLAAYDQVDYFCTIILHGFSDLKRQREFDLLPEETKEAMAGLIFAASRIGELKELQHIRSLFFRRYGSKVDKDSAYLRPGNLVSSMIINTLDTSMQEAITLEKVRGIPRSCQSLTGEEPSNNLASSDFDLADKAETLKTVLEIEETKKKNSMFLDPILGESQRRDPSLVMR